MLDIEGIRGQFPITRMRFDVAGEGPRPLVYMDHGASTHPPTVVLETYKDFLEKSYANVHRGRHYLSEMATDRFEHVTDDILRFIGGGALDLAAHVVAGRPGLTLVSLMEHHSNDLPHRARGAVLHFGVREDGTLDYEDLAAKLSAHEVKLVAVTGASNVTGYLPDLPRVARLAHAHGARVLVDAAQLLAHAPVDVLRDDDPAHLDFLAGAGHKAYAPFGSAFLFGPRDLLDEAPPYIPSGGTVVYVTEHDAFYKPAPERHEAGTPNIAGAVAMGAALRFLEEAGMAEVRAHERALVERAMDGLVKLDGVSVLGHPDPAKRIGALSLSIEGVPHELAATILNREAAIAVRNGCFCAHPYLHRLLGLGDTTELRQRLLAGEDVELPGAVRPTFGIFNTGEEVDELVRMIGVIRDRAWKGSYGEIAGAAACKEL
jgi:cysteine desulfurase/selenocysteine lyase